MTEVPAADRPAPDHPGPGRPPQDPGTGRLPQSTGQPQSTGHPRRWWALFSLVPAVLAIGLDSTVLSVALPTLGVRLHASTDQLLWFMISYTLAFAALMIPGGLVGDRFGRRRTLLGALAVFGAGSVLCATAGSAGAFIAARIVLGVGGAVIMPVCLGALPALFPEEERPKAIATIMATSMLGYPVGPILGGWLLTHVWWGWVFLMNVPMVLAGILAIALFLPESQAKDRRRFDLPGLATSSVGLTLFTYGVTEIGQNGWTDPRSQTFVITGVLVLAAFVVLQRRSGDPLIDLAWFAVRGFSWGAAMSTVVSFVMFGLLFGMPLYFQAVTGQDPQGTGIRLLPVIAGMLVGAPLADRLARSLGPHRGMGLGLLVLAASLGAGSTTTAQSAGWATTFWITGCGLGIGLALPTAMDAALGPLPEESAGVGSALVQALRMVGGSLGAAVLGSVLDAGYRAHLQLTGATATRVTAAQLTAARENVTAGMALARREGSADLAAAVRTAFVHGLDSMLLTSAALAVVCAGLAAAFVPRRAHPAPPR